MFIQVLQHYMMVRYGEKVAQRKGQRMRLESIHLELPTIPLYVVPYLLHTLVKNG